MHLRVLALSSVALVACGGTTPALSGYTAGTATDTCPSGDKWTSGTSESPLMNPGFACQACHLGQNFMGQNPGGKREPEKAFFFMGTVFDVVRGDDLCAPATVPTDAVVEILDTNDVVQLTLPVNAAGNFYSSSTSATVPVPYKARVKANGKVNAMASAQSSGDCNTCHTAAGANGAPGRIFFPQ
ncbi:MAG: hypothetical protein ACOZQL_42000 [Myxococcota bacterium]